MDRKKELSELYEQAYQLMEATDPLPATQALALADKLAALDQLTAAANLLEHARASQGATPELRLALAKLYLQLRRFEALEALLEDLPANETSPELYYLLGLLAFLNGNLKGCVAICELAQTHQRSSTHVEALAVLTDACLRADFSAVEALERIVLDHPNDPTLRMILMMTYVRFCMYSTANHKYWLIDTTDNHQLVRDTALMLRDYSRDEVVTRSFKVLFGIDPTRFETRYLFAYNILLEIGSQERAAEILMQGLRIMPESDLFNACAGTMQPQLEGTLKPADYLRSSLDARLDRLLEEPDRLHVGAVLGSEDEFNRHLRQAESSLDKLHYHQLIDHHVQTHKPACFVEVHNLEPAHEAGAYCASRGLSDHAVCLACDASGTPPASLAPAFGPTSHPTLVYRGTQRLQAGQLIDCLFLDALHHFEQALRYLALLEPHFGKQTQVFIANAYPLNNVVSQPIKETTFWTGDLWRLTLALRMHCPQLPIRTISAMPAGLLHLKDLQHISFADAYGELAAIGHSLEDGLLLENKQKLLNLVEPAQLQSQAPL